MPVSPRETLVGSGAVAIAVRDHGGDGMPVVLLHGAGGNLLAWETLAPRMTGSYRVLAVDLRGHGRSGDGPWEWEAVLDDLEVVTDRFGLADPAVVGHSLGGMVAGMWARRHPGCPAAVSLDGHRSAETHADKYAGMPPERVRQKLRTLNAMFTAQAEMMAQPLSTEQVDALLDRQRVMAAAQGTDDQPRIEATKRGMAFRNGRTWLRPSSDITATLRESAEFLDSLPVFREITIPFLVVLATRNLPGIPEELLELMDAHRAGLRRDLAAITTHRPNIHVREIDASHDMVFERPGDVASVITGFLRDSTNSGLQESPTSF